MANNDFFLRFGSDAADFSGKVSKDLDPAINSIYKLAQALADYDQQAAESAKRPSNPVANTLAELDRAASEFRQLGSELSSTFQETLRTTAGLATELKSLVDTLNSIPAKNKRITETLAANKINEVTPEDIKAAEKKRNLQSTADVLAVNAEEARRGLTRVANVNATIAKNATEGADALQVFGRRLREVLQVARDRGKSLDQLNEKVGSAGGVGNEIRIGNTASDPVPVRVVGGDLDSVGHAGGPVTSPTTTSTPTGPHHHGVPGESPVTGAPLSHHTVSDRERALINAADEAKRVEGREPVLRLPTDIATPGQTVQLPTGKPFFVGHGVREDETIQDYRSRVNEVRKRQTELSRSLPKVSDEDKELQKIFELTGGKRARELFTEVRNRPGIGAVPPNVARLDIDQARGIAQMAAYEKGDEEKFVQLVKRMSEHSEKIRAAYDKFVTEEIARDPFVTNDSLNKEAKAAFLRHDRQVVEGVGARVNPAKTVGEETSFQSTLSFTPEERAGAENRRRIAEVGQNVALNREAKQALDKGVAAAQKLEELRQQAQAELADILHESSLTAEADARRGAVGTSSARVANTGEVLETLAATRANKPEEMAEARRLVEQQAQTVVGDLQGKISRKGQYIARSQATENFPESKINKAQRDLADLRNELAQFTAPKSYADVEHEQKAAEKARKQAEDAAQSNAAKLAASQAQLEAHRAVPPEHIRVTTAGELGNREEYAETTVALESAIREGQEQTASLGREVQFAKQEEARLKQERDALQARAKKAGFGGGATGARKHELAQLTSVAEALHERRTASLVESVTGAPIPELERPEFRPGLPPEVDSEANRVKQLAEVKASINRITDRIRSRNRRDEAKGATARGGTPEETAQLADLQAQVDVLRQAVAEVTEPAPATGGGGGRRPPTPPPVPAAGSNPEPEPEPEPAPTARGRGRGTKYAAEIASLDEDTRAVLANTRARIQFASTVERNALVEQAAQKFREDPAVAGRGPGLTDIYAQRRVFAGAVGLQATRDANLVGRVLPKPEIASSQAAGQLDAAAKAAEHAARMEDIYAESSQRVRIALLAEYKAEQELIALRERKANTVGAEAALERASLQVANAREREAREAQAAQPKTTQQKFFGDKGFIDNQMRHIGLGVENIIGYSLVFTGFEKLRELVHTGLEADAVFVRLQSSLTATGRATGNLRTELQGIASSTATPLETVTEAAAELTGVFDNNKDLAFGTKIASQLANISQGTLTAKEAAIGLRDVTDAYGLSGTKSIQAVGDMIARLSQITGVSVKDITEGTTQLAQEARDFGLKPRQAAVLSAYVTKATGETGEQSAEQVSRLLSTLYTGNVQNTLTRAGVATREQFAQGDIAGVLSNLMQNFDKLNPSMQQTIATLMGSGRQARAFAALMHDGAAAVKEFDNSQADVGTLAKQNQAYLNTIAGTIKQLDEDFQNLGATLTRLGAFDFLGVLAKSLDLLLKAFNATFGWLENLMEKNTITKGIMHISVALLEAAAAMRLFGGVAASTLGKVLGPARFAPLNADEIAGAEAGTVVAPNYGRLGSRRRALRGIEMGLVDAEGAAVAAPGFFGRVGAATREAGVLGGYDVNASKITRYGRALADSESKFATLGTRIERAGVGLTGLNTALAETATRARGAISGISPVAVGVAGGAFVVAGMSEGLKSNRDRKSKRDEAINLATGDLGDENRAALTADTKAVGNTSLWQQLVTGKGRDLGKVSGRSQQLFNALSTSANTRLAAAGGTPEEIQKAQAAIDQDIISQTKKIAQAGGNDNTAQTKVLSQLYDLRASLAEKADLRLKAVQVGNSIDVLNQQQLSDLSDFVTQTSGFSGETLAAFPAMMAQMLGNVGVNGTAAGNALSRASGLTPTLVNDQAPGGDPWRVMNNYATRAQVPIGPVVAPPSGLPISNQARLTGYRDALKTSIEQETIDLGDPKKYGDQRSAAYLQAQQKRTADVQAWQQLQQQIRQNPITDAQTSAAISETAGAYGQSANQLQGAVAALQEWNTHLSHDEPQYYANLKQIQDIQNKIADLVGTAALQGLQLQEAQTVDPVRKAGLALQIAQQQLANAGQDAAKQQAARIAIASATIGGAQARQGLTEAQAQAQNASIRNATAKAQADLNSILQQEGSARGGTLADDTRLAQLQAQEAQARISIRDSVEADTQAVFDVTSALQKLHGDDVGAAQTALAKAQQAYAYAVQEYGASSAQAQSALAQAIQAQQETTTQALNLINSRLDLEIAQLNARGQAGDAEKAAQDAVKKAQNALASYRSRGGQTGTAEYNKLLADVATAQRTAFDTALQAQLDTLDFQRETYKITSSQEVQALQQILKNKQLTLKEQRDITLKIKNLQQSIRDQLTTGGLNIPSDIKLPTAYEVRRSLGAGFGGAATQVNTVNNQQRTSIQITNTVPTAQVAAQIASQVISLINQQTGQQLRANSSTPRLVTTR